MCQMSHKIHQSKILLLFIMLLFYAPYGGAACHDEDNLSDVLLELGVSLDVSSPLTSCPLDKAKIRSSDKYAKEGGKFFANRGTNSCHFALDLEVQPDNLIEIKYGLGKPVYAAAKGTIALANDNWGRAGRTIIIDHGNNIYTLYAHLNKINIRSGKVNSGDIIGEVGYSGNAKNLRVDNLPPHLHFMVFHTTEPLAKIKPLSVVKEFEKADDELPFMKVFGFMDPTNWLKMNGCIN